jgi:DNA-damage-inducible protein D
MEDHLSQITYVKDALEAKKKSAPNGSPYWDARELMGILDYADWRDFSEVIEKAKVACDMSGNFSNDHFVHLPELVGIGSGAQRERDNYMLSKYACHLIAMNGSSAKPEIATAQTYFAVQTQKQESQEQLTDEERRLLLRDRVKDGNKKLTGAARAAGVRNSMFGIFHDEGYKGLYDGLGMEEIRKLKNIPEKEQILDCMGRVELAANEFRITQTEEKLRIDNIKTESAAIKTHRQVGAKVRQTIKEIGGTMPEDLPPEPSIKKLAAKKAKEAKQLN